MYSHEDLWVLTRCSSQEKASPELWSRLFLKSLALGLHLFQDALILDPMFLDACRVTEKQREYLEESYRELPRFVEVLEEKAAYERGGLQFLYYGEEGYPSSLESLGSPPYLLVVEGSLPPLESSYALLGTRKMTDEGRDFTARAASYLKEQDSWVISGLARGIDSVAHEHSLGATGAILGQGLWQPYYPKENRRLAEKILESGGFLLSELLPRERLQPRHLLRRNRLQTALTKACIIAECPGSGGSLQSFRYARAQGKKIYVPSFNTAFLEQYGDFVQVIEEIEEIEENALCWEQGSLFPR